MITPNLIPPAGRTTLHGRVPVLRDVSKNIETYINSLIQKSKHEEKGMDLQGTCLQRAEGTWCAVHPAWAVQEIRDITVHRAQCHFPACAKRDCFPPFQGMQALRPWKAPGILGNAAEACERRCLERLGSKRLRS